MAWFVLRAVSYVVTPPMFSVRFIALILSFVPLPLAATRGSVIRNLICLYFLDHVMNAFKICVTPGVDSEFKDVVSFWHPH